METPRLPDIVAGIYALLPGGLRAAGQSREID